MSYEVARYLKRGRAAGPEVSALDAVMGEDWAIVDPGRARRAHTPRLALRAAHLADVRRGLAGGLLPGRRPQAVVKMVRKGGASDVRGLRAQIAYLSRDGAEPLHRSEAMMGIELDAEEAARLEKEWRMPPEGTDRADRTSHFIVSFPQDSLHAAAERAGRAWAEEMFGSGRYGGDSFDYYTGFHTDRAHPHMHVVVCRRGLEQGEWLKVSQRGDMNYDRMREVLVDVAGREGIELEATTRLARGLHDRPVPDAEYRRAVEQDREADAPGHTHETAIRAAAALIHFSRQFAADARAIERELPEQAQMLHEISERLSEGRAITMRDYGALSPEGEKRMADRLAEVTTEVRGKLERLDNDVVDVEDDATRMRFLRQIAELKANTVPYMRDPDELRAFGEHDDSGRFEAIVPSDPLAREVKLAADDVARNVARDYGLDPDATVERYSGAIPSRGLARQFAEAEERERAGSRALSGLGSESVEDRDAALARMRAELRNVYREGRDIVEEQREEVARGYEDRGADNREALRRDRDGAPVEERERERERNVDRLDTARDPNRSDPADVRTDEDDAFARSVQREDDRDDFERMKREDMAERQSPDDRRQEASRQPEADRQTDVDRQIEDYEQRHGITLSEKDRQEVRDLHRDDDRQDREADAARHAETDRQVRDYERKHGIKLTNEERQTMRDLDGDTDDYDR